MTLEGWNYMTTELLADRAAALTMLQRILSRLKPLYAAGLIAGYYANALITAADYEDFEIERELIDEHTDGRLPVVWVIVSYERGRHQSNPPEIAAAMRELGLSLAFTDPAAG